MYNYGLTCIKHSGLRQYKYLMDLNFISSYYRKMFRLSKRFGAFMNHGLYIFRRLKIIPLSQLGQEVNVYNGMIFKVIRVNRRKIGRRYGEFAFTKQMGTQIHSKVKNKQNKK